jgi:hypothetical protein
MVWLIRKHITLLSGTCVYPNLGEAVRQESAGSYLINQSEWRLLELIEGGFCKDLSWRIRITLIDPIGTLDKVCATSGLASIDANL